MLGVKIHPLLRGGEWVGMPPDINGEIGIAFFTKTGGITYRNGCYIRPERGDTPEEWAKLVIEYMSNWLFSKEISPRER